MTPSRFILLVAAIATVAVRGMLAGASGVVTLAVPDRTNTAPWVAAEGSVVAVAWSASAEGKSDVFVAVSRDAGQTFRAPVRVNAVAGEARVSGEIPPRVAIAHRGGAGEPEIVVLWNSRGDRTEIKTSRSRDGGQTFDAPVAVQSPAAAGDRGWSALALDQTGRAHAIWLDHRGLADGNRESHSGHHPAGDADGAAAAQRSGLYYASISGTATAERELFKGVCYCCKTALAVGPDGSLYAAWRHVYPGNLRDMAFSVSRDGGQSFAPPVRVSEDGWAINGCPDDGPAMAVDLRGTVHVLWPTVVGGANPQGALFYASSTDGRTFTPRVRVPTLGSPKPSHPQIAVGRDGRLILAWDETMDGVRVAASRALSMDRNGHAIFGEPIRLDGAGASTYPVLAATDRGMLAVWMTGGSSSLVRARLLPPS